MNDSLLMRSVSIVIAAFIISVIQICGLLLKRKFNNTQRTISQIKNERRKFEKYLYHLMDRHYLSYWYYSGGEYKVKFKPGQPDTFKMYGEDADVAPAEKSDQS